MTPLDVTKRVAAHGLQVGVERRSGTGRFDGETNYVALGKPVTSFYLAAASLSLNKNICVGFPVPLGVS